MTTEHITAIERNIRRHEIVIEQQLARPKPCAETLRDYRAEVDALIVARDALLVREATV